MPENANNTEDHAPVGPAWLPPLDPVPPVPNWVDARAFAGVWRDTMSFTYGGLNASQRDHPEIRLGAPWDPDPEPGSDQDIDQAIAAKLHLGLRTLHVMATAQHVVVEPDQVAVVPEWRDDEEATRYGAVATLPASPLFLDFESRDGLATAWSAETWPLPFNLRGAVCWRHEGMISIVPFGSVGGVHLWGGTDYQAWSRWIFVQDESPEEPIPGPGDCIAFPDGNVRSWITAKRDSICLHQATIGFNLTRRTLRILWALEALETPLEAPRLDRAARRRAQRAGQTIGLLAAIPCLARDETVDEDVIDDSQLVQTCPTPAAHARLNEAHALWHEALDAYEDPDGFVTKLNALIQALRNVTFGLQKDLGQYPELKDEWYPQRQQEMVQDKRMKWVRDARNQVVKEGDLNTHSKVRVSVAGPLLTSKEVDVDVDPSMSIDQIARQLTVPVGGRRVLEDGTLIVERRWTVDAFPDDELLDILAHCFGKLRRIVSEAHELLNTPVDVCIESSDDPCGEFGADAQPGGRPGCMWAGREARIRRRNLASGAPIVTHAQRVTLDPEEMERTAKHYAGLECTPIPDTTDILLIGRGFHENARKLLLHDGHHEMIGWLLRDGEVIAQQAMRPEDQRDKYLLMEDLAAEMTRLGANELILTCEAWEAPLVDGSDPRSELRAGLRDDRREALVTHVLQRGAAIHMWRTSMRRTERGLELDDAVLASGGEPSFQPIIDAWKRGPGAE